MATIPRSLAFTVGPFIFAAAIHGAGGCSSSETKDEPGAYDAGTPVLTLEPGDAGLFVTGAATFAAKLSLPNDVKKKPRNDAGEIPPRDPPATLQSGDLQWESSEPAVASVNELGRASALKAGATTITAKTKRPVDGGGVLSASAFLSVKNPGRYETLRLEPADKTIAAGETFFYKALAKPYDGTAEEDVTAQVTVWSSSVPTVATLDSAGRARGLCAGTVRVIGTLKFDSEPVKLTVTGCLPDAGASDGGADSGADSGTGSTDARAD